MDTEAGIRAAEALYKHQGLSRDEINQYREETYLEPLAPTYARMGYAGTLPPDLSLTDYQLAYMCNWGHPHFGYTVRRNGCEFSVSIYTD